MWVIIVAPYEGFTNKVGKRLHVNIRVQSSQSFSTILAFKYTQFAGYIVKSNLTCTLRNIVEYKIRILLAVMSRQNAYISTTRKRHFMPTIKCSSAQMLADAKSHIFNSSSIPQHIYGIINPRLIFFPLVIVEYFIYIGFLYKNGIIKQVY